ncbi:protein HEXIM1-like [Littorina saxatilis]|uniref:Uncharacterized protein n=1 Tax=Littorina saxatilis TaxID=31220 RepID=A0AAN9ATF1_9CAEN
MTAVYSMAEDQPLGEVILNSQEEPDKSKGGGEDLDRSKEGDSDELSGSFSDGEGDNGQRNGSDDDNKHRKRRRQRRVKGGKRHHRKYRPYNTLSYVERQVLDEKEAQRASSKRDDLFASGHPLAPFNTTQFLIEDHIKSQVSPDLSNNPSPVPPSPVRQNGTDVADEIVDLPDEKEPDDKGDAVVAVEESQDSPAPADGVYDREFVATYENVNQDRLYTMSRDDLIRMAATLEMKCETMERALRQQRVSGEEEREVNDDSDEREGSDVNSLGSSNEEFGDVDMSSGTKVVVDEC